MSKNIILCADGTGNKGGYTPDSNVYKLYNGVDIHHSGTEQITFYDNGVGTSKNKIKKAVTGALGIGFAGNVRDLYEYLSLNYEPGDKVYVFGFSRGAATIRALLGFISECGLVNGKYISNERLKRYTKDAFNAYKQNVNKPHIAQAFREHENSHGIIDIHFVGVWDTVSALGLPENTDKVGFISGILSKVFEYTDKLLNIVWPHHFYHYHLTNNIKYAYQALALDDARTSFWPKVWNEKGRNKDSVEQVWFAGMHSNVGGGYERQGLANVALHWMLVRAENKGLKFKPDFIERAHQDSNVTGRLYNSRDGIAILYRYHPREIENLCRDKLNAPVKIHETVFHRMQARTADYAPTHLPDEFDVVYSEITKPPASYNFASSDNWKDAVTIINKNVSLRKINYMTLLVSMLYLVYLMAVTWFEGVTYWGRSGVIGDIADSMHYFIPDILDNLVELSFMHYPVIFSGILIFYYLLFKYNQYITRRMHEGALTIRSIINNKIKS